MERKLFIEQIEDQASIIMDDVKETGKFLWNNPEIANREFKCSTYLANKYKNHGFRVFRGIGGFPTSFISKFRNGNPIIKIGIFSDFDALPDLSTVNEGEPGHGCSHNLYAATAYGTALVLKDIMTRFDIEGEITVIGAPAEEKGGSKQHFVNQGILDDFDAFIGLHPVSSVNGVMYKRHIASIGKSYCFKGLPAHAAIEPEKGLNALSAMEYMNVGVNYLRGQVPSDVRINYIVKQGGIASNIITEKAEVEYSIRAESLETLDNTTKLIDNVAECAAKAMMCELDQKETMKLPNSIPNKILSKLAQNNAKVFGPPAYSEEIQNYIKDLGYPKGYLNDIVEMPDSPTVISGSTDEASVSWIAPWVRISLASIPQGVSAHTKDLNFFANLDYGYKGIEKTIMVASMTIIDLLREPYIIEKAKNELINSEYKMGNNSYEVKPQYGEFPTLNGITLKENVILVDLNKLEIFSELNNCEIHVYSGNKLIGKYLLRDERQFSIKIDQNIENSVLAVKFVDEDHLCTISYINNSI